nr:dystroglycan-like [Ipomoea batatas]
MATNPVPQRNHPSNAEEQENLEKPTLAHLAKQTHTGQILHVPDSDFLNVVDDKILGNQIIQALGNSGILRLCTYPFSGIYEEDVAEFYLHSSIDNLSIKSIVNETPLEIMPSDLGDIFDLPETDLENSLKWEFEKFIDILYKYLEGKTSSIDEINTQKITLMNGVWQGIRFNWAGYVYNKIAEFCKNAKPDKPDETFVLKKLKQHVGYGFVISEIMRKKGVPLRKPKNVASFKYLFRNPKTLRRRKPTEASTTSRDTMGSNAPKKKRGRPAKRTSRISEGLGSNEAPLVVMESANDEIVTSNLIETAIVPVMPTGDHQPYPPSLPTEFTNNEALISPLQIEGLDSQLEANILEKGSEPFFDEDPILAIELLRVKEWRKWRLEEYQSHISRAGPEIEKEELFALDWLGTEDIATAIQMSTIEEAYTNKVQAKLARSKEKLPVMEESFYALSVEDFEELDQANLQEGLQRSIMDFHHFPEKALIFQHDGNAMTQEEGPSNANEREIQILNEVPVQITVEEQDVEPVTVPEQDQVTVVVENLVEEPVEKEIAAEVEEQVMIPNVTNAENISYSVTVPAEAICEGVVTAQDETLVEANLDESQHGITTDVPTAPQSHEMDTTENLPNTLE